MRENKGFFSAIVNMIMIKCLCVLKAILNGDEEVKAWLDYESVPLDEVPSSLRLV